MKNRQRQRGFTLLEIMIALTIFAVISTLAWQILDGAMRTSSATENSAAKLNQLQRAWSLMERDFFQIVLLILVRIIWATRVRNK